MTIETFKSLNPRDRNSISVIKSKFLSVSSMNTLLAILKVTDVRRDVIMAGGLYHRFPWRHLSPPPPLPGLKRVAPDERSVIEHYVRMKETSKLIPLLTQKQIIYVQICHQVPQQSCQQVLHLRPVSLSKESSGLVVSY